MPLQLYEIIFQDSICQILGYILLSRYSQTWHYGTLFRSSQNWFGKWFTNANLFLIKHFLNANFDCSISEKYLNATLENIWLHYVCDSTAQQTMCVLNACTTSPLSIFDDTNWWLMNCVATYVHANFGVCNLYPFRRKRAPFQIIILIRAVLHILISQSKNRWSNMIIKRWSEAESFTYKSKS
jgi:hypothetical protein